MGGEEVNEGGGEGVGEGGKTLLDWPGFPFLDTTAHQRYHQ